MKTELHDYDIYPKVVLEGKETRVTIRSLGRHADFNEGETYRIRIYPMNQSNEDFSREKWLLNVTAEAKELSFIYRFEEEQEYNLVICGSEENCKAELRLYCLKKDLFSLIPLMGDLHVHSFRSDGKEAPEIVAANYRKAGFDFMTVSDHEVKYPSHEAIDSYKDVKMNLLIVPGEEVHTPKNKVHVVNFGADISVNDLYRQHREQYDREVEEIRQELRDMDDENQFQYAASVWAFNKIKENNGLAIFPHPHWITDRCYHVPLKLVQDFFKNRVFDAFELIGGQTLHENGMQINLYHELCMEGYSCPIVGSSDSHGTVNSEWFQIGKTVVLAKENSRDAIIDAIKDYRAAALEQYAWSNGEERPRVYGPFRIASYVEFLLNEYFPLHDELCREEGRAMKDYVNGVEGAREELEYLGERTRRTLGKYFGT